MKLILGTVQLGKKYSKFLEDKVNYYKSVKLNLYYPILDDIPILLINNALRF